ncbi:MAG: hypothetical protein ACYC35_13575 [Pirellulales bacterium]
MKCHELAERVERLQPDAQPREVARLCLLLTNYVRDLDLLDDESQLAAAWQEMSIRLQAVTDQHAAMAEELDAMSKSDPNQFTAAQMWVLIRALKVQSQILQMYVGQPPVEV